jgi:hypothetical protein
VTWYKFSGVAHITTDHSATEQIVGRRYFDYSGEKIVEKG